MMELKNLVIICTIIILCAIVAAVAIVLNQSEEIQLNEETQIKVLSNSSLYDGENVTVQLTTENGTALSNQAINVTVVDGDGNRNVQNLVTDGDGKASFTLSGLSAGEYSLECVFGGSEGYNPSNTTASLEIKEKTVNVQKSSGSGVVGEEVIFNAQKGEGYFREVSYSDGNFRQYDIDTGKLIGSSYQSDQKYLPQMY